VTEIKKKVFTTYWISQNWAFPYDGKVIMNMLLNVFVNSGTYDCMMQYWYYW